ncbi:MAG: transporter [Marmoricola sp.]|nr:transporter [Marmoricola sp.]
MRGVSWVLPMRRNRDFMWLWSGQAASELGSSMSVLVFPLLGYSLSGSTRVAGLATTGVLVGGLLASLPAGVVVDRTSRRRVLVVANLVGAAAFGVLAVMTVAGVLTIAGMVVLGVVAGAASAFVRPANGAAVRAVVPPEELGVALAQSQARHHAAELAGPPAGGALYSLARPLPFVVDTLSYLFAAYAVTRVRHPLPPPDAEAEPLRRSLGEGLRFLWRSPVMRAMMGWAAANNLAATYLFVLITLRLVQAGVTPAAIGLVSTISAAAGLVGAALAPAIVRRVPTGWMTVVTGVVSAAALLGTAFTTDVVVIGALWAVSSVLFPATNSGIGGYSSAVVPHRMQGRMYAASGLVANGLTPLSPLLAGVLLADVGGVWATVAGAVALGLAVTPIVATRETRTLGRPSTWPVAAEPAPQST